MEDHDRQFGTKKHGNFSAIFLVGLLSMFFAEVMAGSSNLWFLDPFGWALTYVLYCLHLLFYLNIAVRTKRASIKHLYLWGSLFALYEAPITQVLWSGYLDANGPQINVILGIAPVEFIVLVFFWHPIMSFMLPVLMYEAICLSSYEEISQSEKDSPDAPILPGHENTLAKMKTNRKWILLIFFFLAGNQLIADGFNVLIALGSYIGSILLILLGIKLANKKAHEKGRPLSINDLILSNKGLKKVVIILILWVYLFGSWIISKMVPGRWPNSIVAYITPLVYAFIILLILKGMEESPESGFYISPEEIDSKYWNAKDLKLLFSVLVVAEIVLTFVGTFIQIVFTLIYIAYGVVGVILFLKVILTRKPKNMREGNEMEEIKKKAHDPDGSIADNGADTAFD